MLEEFLKKNRELFEDDYVVVKIDTANMENGGDVAQRLRKDRPGGIPWMVILDADGNELITSNGPDGNIGCPILPHEVEHFLTMIQTTKQRASSETMAALAQALEKNAEAYRNR